MSTSRRGPWATSPRGRLFVASAAFAAAAFAGCGAGQRGADETPSLALSRNTNASRALEQIRDRWTSRTLADPAHRVELSRALEQFLADYPSDPLASVARIYLAFVHIENGDLAAANSDLERIGPLRAGWVRDFENIASARVARLGGNPLRAVALLQPLEGKLVDEDSLSLYLEEYALSLVGSGREDDALLEIDRWLRHSEDDEQEEVRKRIAPLVKSMKTEALVRALERSRSGKMRILPELYRLVTERLASVAVTTNDLRLARWLAGVEARSESIDINTRLHELATRERDLVRGRTVGLLLSSGDFRDNAAQAARGVAWALGLPRTNLSDTSQTELVTRDDGGTPEGIAEGLDELASDGAAVILAGFDATSAEHAIRWSEESGVPLITLTAPKRTQKMATAFVLGEPREGAFRLMVTRLLSGGRAKVAPIADHANLPALARALSEEPKLVSFQPVPCEAPEGRVGLPVAVWEKASFRTWFIAGPVRCARDALRLLDGRTGGLAMLSLEAFGDIELPREVTVEAVGAGRLPVVGTPEGDLGDFAKAFGTNPDWATALGRDAGRLAKKALESLPLGETYNKAEVRRRRDQVRSALLHADESLWTSERRTFSADHTLSRTLRITTLQAAKSR